MICDFKNLFSLKVLSIIAIDSPLLALLSKYIACIDIATIRHMYNYTDRNRPNRTNLGYKQNKPKISFLSLEISRLHNIILKLPLTCIASVLAIIEGIFAFIMKR